MKRLEDRLQRMEKALKKMAEGKKGAVTPGGAPTPPDDETIDSSLPAPARITVQLPTSARLFVDNVECPLTSSSRSFLTPGLERGRRYYYTLRMEVIRDGQVVRDSRRVVVGAGATVQVDFNRPAILETVLR